ncbi:MAG: DNA-primase RepB domain-containing protein [Thermofilaceae archaeon]
MSADENPARTAPQRSPAPPGAVVADAEKLFYDYPAGRVAAAANLEEVERFLEKVWSVEHHDAICYAIVVMLEGKLRFAHFCIDKAECRKPERCARAFLEKLKGVEEAHIFFQVLPLAYKPEKGRGSERDVKVGQWLWCDLDYKEVVDEPAFSGCREGDDFRLECYYREGGKWIHVKRPPLSEVLEQVVGKLGVEPTIIVDSGAGYHLYFKLSEPLEAAMLKLLEEKLVSVLGGDPQSKDLARILRLPGTVNPRVGRLARVIRVSDSVVNAEMLAEKLGGEERRRGGERGHVAAAAGGGLRELSDAEVLKIVELLKDSYKPGYRQLLLLFLCGWLAKRGVSPLSAAKVVKTLYESTGDTDPLRSRLSTVTYTYRKAGVSLEPYADAIEQLTGVRPYGLEGEVREEEVKGRSGLQEILEETVGEERALAVLHGLSELLGTLSPFKDSVIELIDEGRQLYAVANLRKLVIARARRTQNGFAYMERVAVVAPTRVVVYENPLGGVRKYEVTFEGFTMRKPLVVGPAMAEEIADRLRAEGVVYHERLLPGVLNAILQAFIRKGRAEVRAEIESPGFYLMDGKLVSVKYEVGEPDRERLAEALKLLDELAEEWFKHAKDKLAMILKWGAVAPFAYVIKQRGRWLRWLFLYGDAATGKTTLGRVVLRMWGLDSRYEKKGGNVDTVARLGHVVSQATFPVLVEEPGGALGKEDVVEAMKGAIDGTVVRGKFQKGTYVEIPALAPLILTSNVMYPRDDALRRRLYVVTFSYGEKIPREKADLFKERVEPRLSLLDAVGRFIAYVVFKAPHLLDRDPLLAGEALLKSAYEYVGMKPPEWLSLTYEEEEDPRGGILEHFAEALKKHVNEMYIRYISRELRDDSLPVVEKLRVLVEKNLVPGVRKMGRDHIAITSTFLKDCELEGVVSLKSLAEMLGGEYKVVKMAGAATRGVCVSYEQLEQLFSQK